VKLDRHPDQHQLENLDFNLRSLLVEATKVQDALGIGKRMCCKSVL